MDPHILAQVASRAEDVVTIPMYSVGLISVVFALMLVPWVAWVTSTVYDLKRAIALSNEQDRNINEKLTSISENIRDQFVKVNQSMKEMDGKLDSFIANEFQFMKQILTRHNGEDH
jgi:predicted PurR-regulated permease PerM